MCATTGPAIQTYAQLRAGGLSRPQLEAQLAVGSLIRLRRGVYAVSGTCVDVRDAATHGGSLACVSGLRHRGVWVLDDAPDLHVWMLPGAHRRHPSSTAGVPACACVAHWDAASGDRFEIPSVARLLRQLLMCRGTEDFFVSLESALRQGMLDSADLAWLRGNTNDAGRAAIAFARTDADSGIESLLRWRLRAHGLQVRTQARIPSVGIVDLLIGDRLLVEADGGLNHASAPLRHKDLVRDANAAAWGYVTLRFDYAMIVHDWDLVERAILGAVHAGHHR